MNLLEISDEFNVEKVHPQDVLELLKRRQKIIDWQLDQIRDVVQNLHSQFQGTYVNAAWQSQDPQDPEQKKVIDATISQGFVAVMKPVWHDETRELVDGFAPDTPANKVIASRLENAFRREAKLQHMRHDIPAQVRRAKSRLSAWKRKQPDYVGRETGKDLAKSLSDALVKLLTDAGCSVRLKNQFYWKKNKMVVIEIATELERPWVGLKPWELMDQKIKPMVDKYLIDHGYGKVRLSSFYDRDIAQNVLKLQIDDAEARDISKSDVHDETE